MSEIQAQNTSTLGMHGRWVSDTDARALDEVKQRARGYYITPIVSSVPALFRPTVASANAPGTCAAIM